MSRLATARRGASALLAFATVAVTSSLALASPDPQDDIRDIRGLIPIPPWWRWPVAIALSAIAACAIILLVRYWRARTARALTPLERAEKAFDLAETHAREGRLHEWAEIVAETTREALAARLGTDVLPQTTFELSKASWTKAPLAEEIDAAHILELLETCDLARFAKANLDTRALLAATALGRDLTRKLFAPPRPAIKAHAPAAAPGLAQTETVTP